MSGQIIVGFSRPKARFQLFADAIMTVDGSNFSHAYVRFHSDEFQRDIVFQASGLKVNFIGWEKFESLEVIVKEFSIPASDATKLRIMQFAIDNLGDPYDIAGVANIAAEKLAKLFGMTIKPPFKQRGYFCDELVAYVIAGFFKSDLTLDEVKKMTPTDVYEYLLTWLPGVQYE